MKIKEIPKPCSVTTFDNIPIGEWFLRAGTLAVKISDSALLWFGNPTYILDLSKSGNEHLLNMEINPVDVELNYWRI